MPPANQFTISVGFSDEDIEVVNALKTIILRLESITGIEYIHAIKGFMFGFDDFMKSENPDQCGRAMRNMLDALNVQAIRVTETEGNS